MGRQIKLCDVGIGNYVYEVFTNGEGGCGWGSTKPTQICIGLSKNYTETYSVLLHEIVEALFQQYHVRWDKLDTPHVDSGQVMFQFDHWQFSAIMAEAAESIVIIEPLLKKAWNEFTKNSK